MKLFIRNFAIAAALVVIATIAYAGISEINTQFQDQSGPFSNAAVFAIGSSANGNYMLCLAFNSPSPPVTGTLEWTDENGNIQTWSDTSGCTAIRGLAGSTVYVSTAGSSGSYSLAVIGFGLWPGQPQKQGGISEVSTGSISAGPYLFLVQPCSGTSTLTIPGFGAFQAEDTTAIFLPALASSGTLSFSTTCLYPPSVTGISFGTPKIGAGPLTDYERNLIDWTDATYPNYERVFSSSQFVNVLIATNIAEVPNNGSVAEDLSVWTVEDKAMASYGCNLVAQPSGAPSACVILAPGSVSVVDYFTLNITALWGTSPTYNAEVAAIQY